MSTITIATVAIFGEFRPNDKLILYPLLFGATSSTVLRLFYLITSKQCLKHGYLQKSVLLVGSGHTARQIVSKVLSTPALGFRIKGVLSDNDLGLPAEGLYLGKLEQFSDILRRDAIDEVIIAESSSETLAIRRIIDRCEEEGLRFCIVPDFYHIIPKWTISNSIGDIPVIAARKEPLNIFSNRMIKRAFDILVSLVGLLTLSPLLLVIAHRR